MGLAAVPFGTAQAEAYAIIVSGGFDSDKKNICGDVVIIGNCVDSSKSIEHCGTIECFRKNFYLPGCRGEYGR